MDKKLKKFKNDYLNELTCDDSTKEEIQEKLEIVKNNKQKKNIFKQYRRPLVLTATTLIFVMVIILASISIVNYQNTPVYKGMSIESLETLNHKENVRRVFSSNLTDDINEEIGVIVDNSIVYYAKPKEEIVINVKIDNPKSFEILSFTLNGRLYQSYEFIEGSNSTNIRVKFICQEQSGIQIITIDAIKYVDGTTIKKARFDGNRTLKVGITYQNIPAVSHVNENCNANNVSLSFVVTDSDNLININTGLKVYLFDNDKIINISSGNLGPNQLSYRNLKYGNEYTYIIIGVFDLYDGVGKKAHVLHQNSITTTEGFSIKKVETKYNSITVEYEALEGLSAELTKIELLLDNQVVSNATIIANSANFENLQSNCEYTLRTTYKYQLIDNNQIVEITKSFDQIIKTSERQIPTMSFESAVGLGNFITAFIQANDIDEAIISIEIQLYKDGILVSTVETLNDYTENEPGKYTGNVTFNNLESGEYELVIKYQYDLDDGNGIQTVDKDHPTADNKIKYTL